LNGACSVNETIRLLRAARTAEKAQTLFYRALSAIAEARHATADIEALNGLLADEQHHLSRLSVRLLELGAEVENVTAETPEYDYSDWRYDARRREQEEIARYELLLRQPLDEQTAAMLRGILAVEQQHEANLGGKYTEA
jgi:rubrerythrin